MALVDSAALAIIGGLGFLAAFFVWVAFKLQEGTNTHEAIGLFLMLMGFVQTIIIGDLLSAIAIESALPASVLNDLANSYHAVIITFVILLVYFVLRVMVLPMIQANKKKNFKLPKE